MIHKRIIKQIILSAVAFASCFFACSGFERIDTAFTIEKELSTICDINKKNYTNNLYPSIMSLSCKYDKENFSDFSKLQHYYRYSTAINAAFNTFGKKYNAFGKSTKTTTNISSINTFDVSSTKTKDDLFKLTYDNIYLYFCVDDLDGTRLNSIRNGAQAFTIISDSFANLLLEQNNLEPSAENYKKLIQDNELNIITFGDGESSIKCCVNNIVSTKKGDGYYQSLIDKNFMIIYLNDAFKFLIKDNIFVFFLKTNPFVSRKLIYELRENGFDINEYSYDFLSADDYGCYEIRPDISSAINSALKNVHDWSLIVIVFISAASCLALFFLKKHKAILITLLGLSFTLMGIISIFSLFEFIYGLSSVFPACTFLMCLMLLLPSFKKTIKVEKVDVYEIEI